MRLIDADELRELFGETIVYIAKRPDMSKNLEYMIRSSAMAIKMIDDQPTVDAIPIEWIEQKMKELDTDTYEYEWLIAQWRIESYETD